MPPADGTRSQAQAQAQERAIYDRLLKRATTVHLSDTVAKTLATIAKTTLELYSPATPGEPERPLREEVRSLMKSLLPAPAQIFTESFIRSPLFPILLLRDVASFYGCGATDTTFTNSLNLSASELTNRNVMAHIWFAYFAGCDSTTTQDIVECYKRTRGSSDILINSRTEPRAANRQEPSRTPAEDDAVPQHQITQDLPPQRDSLQNVSPFDAQHNGMNNAAPGSVQPQNTSQSHGLNQGMNGEPLTPHPPLDRSSRIPPHLGDYDDTRKASYVQQYFKDRKFTGDLTQSIELVLRDYNVCARQHKLSRTQMADYFVNILDGPARTFFFNNARNEMTFSDMASMMVREYNSDARQLHVKGILEGLRLQKFMAEHNIANVSQGLTKLINLIEELTPQCQPQFRSDAHKVSFLRKAILGYAWAKGPISNIITSRYTFNAFVTALRESIQLENEISLASNTSTFHTLATDTHYQQYGRHPKSVRKYDTPHRNGRNVSGRPPARTFEESRRRNECHKCGDRWKPGHRCRPGAIRDFARQRLENGVSAVHLVSNLVLGLEGELTQNEGEDDESLPPKPADPEESISSVYFGEAASEAALFDLLTSGVESRDTHLVEAVDKEWFTNHLSLSVLQGEQAPPSLKEEDF